MIEDESILQKYKDAPFRAPMIIILVTKHQEHPKVPLIEQKLSTAASAQNILLALESYGYAGIWRTGKFSFNNKLLKYLNLDDNNTILGYLYVGTRDGDKNFVIVLMNLCQYGNKCVNPIEFLNILLFKIYAN